MFFCRNSLTVFLVFFWCGATNFAATSVTQSVGCFSICNSPALFECFIVFSSFVLFADASRQSLCHEVITFSVWTSLFTPVTPVDMGLHESVSSWRWQGSGGAFRAAVGVLLLGLSLAQSAPPHAACPAAAAPQSVPQPQYQDTEKDVMGFLSGFVHSFLQTVQPNALPKGQCHWYYSPLKLLESLTYTRFNLSHIDIFPHTVLFPFRVRGDKSV